MAEMKSSKATANQTLLTLIQELVAKWLSIILQWLSRVMMLTEETMTSVPVRSFIEIQKDVEAQIVKMEPDQVICSKLEFTSKCEDEGT